jgi:hypothetical protein
VAKEVGKKTREYSNKPSLETLSSKRFFPALKERFPAAAKEMSATPHRLRRSDGSL